MSWSDAEIQAAIQMRHEGMTSREIGNILGRSSGAVRTALRKAGVAPPRAQWMAQFDRSEVEDDQWMRDAEIASAKLRDALLRMAA
jgi:predicted transcriptional regulator